MPYGKKPNRIRQFMGDNLQIKINDAWTAMSKQNKWRLQYEEESTETTFADGTTQKIKTIRRAMLTVTLAQTSGEEIGLFDVLRQQETVEIWTDGGLVDGKSLSFYIPAAMSVSKLDLETPKSPNMTLDIEFSCQPQSSNVAVAKTALPTEAVADTNNTGTNEYFCTIWFAAA